MTGSSNPCSRFQAAISASGVRGGSTTIAGDG